MQSGLRGSTMCIRDRLVRQHPKVISKALNAMNFDEKVYRYLLLYGLSLYQEKQTQIEYCYQLDPFPLLCSKEAQ